MASRMLLVMAVCSVVWAGTFSVDSVVVPAGNESFGVSLRADHPEPIQGLFWALTFDPAALSVTEVLWAGTAAADAEWVRAFVDPVCGSVQMHLIMDWSPPHDDPQIPPGTDQVIAELRGELSDSESKTFHAMTFDTSCVVTASGMGAIMSAVDPLLIKQQDGPEKINFVSNIQVYGGTFQQFSIRKMEERGIECRWVLHPDDLEEWKSKIDENTRFLYAEAPSNPQQAFCDIKEVASLAHSWEIPFIVDATCATPALMRPIEFGADIVVHSMTKTITSSGFAIGGALISRKPIVTKLKHDHPLFKESFAEYVKFLPYRDNGPASAPVNAMFALNDLRTLRSRMDLFSRNCQTVGD